MNRFHLTGQIGRAPVIRQAGRTTVAELELVAERAYYDRQGHRQERIDCFNLLVFGPLARRVEILDAGDKVAVEGRLQTRQDRRDGRGRLTLELVAERVELQGRGGVLGGGAIPAEWVDG